MHWGNSMCKYPEAEGAVREAQGGQCDCSGKGQRGREEKSEGARACRPWIVIGENLICIPRHEKPERNLIWFRL